MFDYMTDVVTMLEKLWEHKFTAGEVSKANIDLHNPYQDQNNTANHLGWIWLR